MLRLCVYLLGGVSSGGGLEVGVLPRQVDRV